MRRLLLSIAVPSLFACSVDEPEVGRVELGARTLNAQSADALTRNALLLDPPVRLALLGNALASATFAEDGPIPYALHDENAQEVMHYLVGCALSGTQSVSYTDPFDGESHHWRGSLGLCTAWGSSKPSLACQEVVSACLIARVNAEEKTVGLSIRGEKVSGAAVPLEAAVPTETFLEDGSTQAVFQACPVVELGPDRDCGWRPAHLGRCTPGTKVTVGAAAPPPLMCWGGAVGSSVGDTMLRVCEDRKGCTAADALAQADDTCGSSKPAATFVCPANGLFSVMRGAHASNALGWSSSPAALNADYVLDEQGAYVTREGSYYGNAFTSVNAALFRRVEPDGDVVEGPLPSAPTTVFEDMWACADPGWSDADAYAHDRLCALANGFSPLCAATPVGTCTDVCATQDDGPIFGDGDAQGCADGAGVVRQRALTTWLIDACDVVEDPLACRRD